MPVETAINSSLKIAITTAIPTQLEAAQQLARQLNLPIVTTPQPPYEFFLTLTAQRIEVVASGSPPSTYYIDFLTGATAYRLRQSTINKELIAKAVGIKANYRPHLLDVTAGWGQDAAVLARLGCSVTMVERNPIIATLLADALARLQQTEQSTLFKQLRLIADNALHYLSNLPKTDYPEVIYLDPMYPARTKSALVKKEMTLLRKLVGDDTDAELVLQQALQVAQKRVVVKRPRLAPSLSADAYRPNFTIMGSQQRFDVYLTSHLCSPA